ncbi:hypothetical protein MNBD_UNCLBAC01-327 [hydrothermal vent metagenome]|uniref:SPOR domain-containing protein n=1 Tax=hydrothermal vent metagenome TaxID=652676 RepID=A0A3B1DIB0_9ZZZZ
MFRLLSYLFIFALGLLVGNGTLTDISFSPITKWFESQSWLPQKKIEKQSGSTKKVEIIDWKLKPEPKSVKKNSPSSKKNTINGLFTVQVGAFKDLKEAQQLVKQLIDKNIDAYIAPKVIGKQGNQYRVFVGEYLNKQDATKKLLKLNKYFSDAFVRLF